MRMLPLASRRAAPYAASNEDIAIALSLPGLESSELVSEFLLLGFVVGCPLDRFRSPNRDAVQMKVFIDELSKTGKLEGVCYTYWEETFTSKNVELLLQPLTLHPVVAKTIMDKFAAMGILQGYLDYANKKQRSESSE
ncbi:putative pre-16S rRNA nuclease [Eucalyptus grandis]|uniref:putative pre-16S rRNA nuclease n=1 Tax=Eucalyptus grandis TaxID=71139 RepID=UPI00192EAC28|nr:putative pre-16S rRNA nuclease [Eucalyptus grandis]